MSVPVFMLAMLVLYVPNQGLFPTTLGVMGLNVFNLLFAFTVLTIVMQRPVTQTPARNVGDRQRPPFTNVLLAYYGVLTLALAIALLGNSPHPVDDVVAWKNLVSYSLLYFLAYYAVRSLSQVRFLVIVILLVFVIASAEAVMQGINYGLHEYANDRRASGPFGEDAGNSNFAGIFYAIFSTFALAIALLGKRIGFSWRMLAAAAYVIGCLAILATFSRQAFLVIGVTTLLLALRRNPLIAIAIVAFLAAYPLWAPQGVIERIAMTQQTTTSGEEVLESSAASRYALWGGALEIIKRNPAGVGMNQFQREVEPYLPEWIMARDAQNQYLRFAAETGIQGLLVFLILLLSFIRLGLRIRRLDSPPDAGALGSAFIVSTLAVCLGNIFSSTFAFGEIMASFWIMSGLLAKYLVLAQSEATSNVDARVSAPIDTIRQVYARWNHTRETDQRSIH